MADEDKPFWSPPAADPALVAFRRSFDAARDPQTARNALGILDTAAPAAGAPLDAEYITAVDDPTLPNDRALTDTATVTWDFSTPGQAKANAVGGAGSGNVTTASFNTAGQYARWTSSLDIEGVAPATVLTDIGAQPLDGDLTSLAAATGTNEIYYRSATDTWAAVTIGSGLSFTFGTLSATGGGSGNVTTGSFNSAGQYARWTSSADIEGVSPATVLSDIGAQPLDADLTAIAALTGTNTIYYRSAANTWTPVVVSTGLAFSSGNLTATGVASTPGGSNTQVQFNDSSAFGGDADLIWNKTTNLLTVNGNISITGGVGNSLLANAAIQGSLFRCPGTVAVYGTELTSGVVNLRPNGVASSTGQFQVQSTGTVVVNGNIELGATDTTLSRVSAGVAAIEGQNILTAATGAPIGSEYITSVSDATLTAERVLTDSASITWDRTVAGQIKANSSAGGGNVSNSGTPTAGQYGRWVTATTIEGVAPATVLSDIGAAPLASPTFTGDPKAPTPTAGDNDTSIATTAFVTAAVAAGGSGAAEPGPPQGRLTLQTATPVMITTQSAKTTTFYTPYCGDQIGLYNGTSFVMTTFAELSNVTTASSTGSAGPAAVAANSMYDLYVWSNSGTVTLTRGPAWTNDTTRSAGTALVRTKGLWLNNAAITNGPAASRGTYVGTIRSNASSQIDWILGTFGTAAVLHVWNAYNRVDVITGSGTTTDSWTTASATFARGDALNTINFVSGLAEDAFLATYDIMGTASASGFCATGIGYDVTTTTKSGTTGWLPLNFSGSMTAMYGTTVLGRHFVCGMETSGGGTATFYGDSGVPGVIQTGIWLQFRM